MLSSITYWDFIARNKNESMTLFESDSIARKNVSEFDSFLYFLLSNAIKKKNVYIVQRDNGVPPQVALYKNYCCIAFNHNFLIIDHLSGKRIFETSSLSIINSIESYYGDLFVLFELELIIFDRNCNIVFRSVFSSLVERTSFFSAHGGLHIVLEDNSVFSVVKRKGSYEIKKVE